MAELKDLLDERRKMVDKKATQHREIRDDWNEKTKTYTSTRNELNNEVRELIVQVREQRDLRDQMNEMVREKKKEREDANKSVREAKDAMRAGQPEQPQQFDRRGRPIRPDTVQSLTRTMERLEREFEQGKHQGKNERKYFKKMKELSAKRKALKEAQVATESAEGSGELREAMALQELLITPSKKLLKPLKAPTITCFNGMQKLTASARRPKQPTANSEPQRKKPTKSTASTSSRCDACTPSRTSSVPCEVPAQEKATPSSQRPNARFDGQVARW